MKGTPWERRLSMVAYVCPDDLCRTIQGVPTPQENKAAVLGLLDEVFGKRNPAAFLDALSPDVVLHLPGYPEPFHGPEAVRDWAAAYLAGWNSRMTVETAVAEGENVLVRWTMRATHTGDYLGVPPTGKEALFTEFAQMRLADGKAEEIWIVLDTLDVIQQLGLFPKGKPPRPLLRFIIWLQRLRRPAPLRRKIKAPLGVR
jgi:ketosteroid isomerase-like protein